MRVLLLLRRVGPYHQARINAIARYSSIQLYVVQTRPHSLEYPWEQSALGSNITCLSHTLNPETDPTTPHIDHQLEVLRQELKPDVLVAVGWSDKPYLRLISLSYNHNIPLVIISDSRYQDHPRSLFKESIKRLLVQGYSSSLVAGQQSHSYLCSLGMPPGRIFTPWDVVDNDFFSSVHPDHSRSNQFICVSRFISKKNLSTLLRAFHLYKQNGGNWSLLIVGDGPLRPTLFDLRSSLGITNDVSILPFHQYTELRQLYHSAKSLILPSLSDQWGLVVNEAIASGLIPIVSNQCGCVPDLLVGHSDLCFDPLSVLSLSRAMQYVSSLSPKRSTAILDSLQTRLTSYSLESFTSGFSSAISFAFSNPRKSFFSFFASQLLSLI